MSRDATRGAHAYAAEGSWAENLDVGWIRTPIADRADTASLRQAKLVSRAVKQLRNEGPLYFAGPMNEVNFTTTYELCGHGSVTSGAMAATRVPTLLKYVFGYAPTPPAGTTFNAGWDTDNGDLAAASGFAGWIGFAGVKGDGRGDGQAALVLTHATNAAVLANALPGAPAAADVFHSAELVHTVEGPTDAQQVITGTRHLLQTANQMYRLHGCFPRATRITDVGHGAVPMISIDWGASYFTEQTSQAFPSALATDEFVPSHNGGGTLHIQEHGVTTRNVREYRDLSLNIELGIRPLPGPGGVFVDQYYTKAVRVPDVITMQFSELCDDAGTQYWVDRWKEKKYFTVVGSLNLRASQRMAFAGIKCCITDIVRQEMKDDLNMVTVTMRFHADPQYATEVQRAALRIAFA